MGEFLSNYYFGELGAAVDEHLPFLGVKMKEKCLSIGGRSFSYEDATKFVARDGSYIPVVAMRGAVSGERVVDLYPFINVGLAEVLLAIESNRERMLKDIVRVLTSERLFDSVESSLDYLNQEESFGDELEWSIRSSQIRHDFPAVKKIVCLLNIARRVNPRFYFEQIFDLAKIAYSSCLIWIDKSMDGLTMSFASKLNPKQIMETKMQFVGGITYPGALDTGAISYTTESGATRTVTDGRGLSVYVFLLFLYHVYTTYASFPGGNRKSGIGSTDAKTIGEHLQNCIGNDMLGKWFLQGKEPSGPDVNDRYLVSILENTGLSPWDGKRKVQDGYGNETTRAMIDNTEMFRRATGWERSDKNSLCYNNCFYETFEDTCCMVVWEIFCHEEYPMLAPKNDFNRFMQEYMQKVNRDMSEKMGDLMKEKNAFEKERSSMLSKISERERETAAIAEERDKLKLSISLLERQLETQRRIVAEQQEEIEMLRARSECVYSEEVCEASVGDEASLEEMVSYLREFKITVVGGHFDTERRLSSMGLDSVTYVTNEQTASGNAWDADFICICASFVSHKIVMAVEARFQDKRGETMYFNGTNAEKMVRSMYDFVRKWMEEP